VVVCGERRFLDDRRDTLLNPSLLIEVLSPTTEAYDRGQKFEHYRSLESFGEYLLSPPTAFTSTSTPASPTAGGFSRRPTAWRTRSICNLSATGSRSPICTRRPTCRIPARHRRARQCTAFR